MIEVAQFLERYGPYGMASIFLALWALERRERQRVQTAYLRYLEQTPLVLREYADAVSSSVRRLELAFVQAQIELPPESS